MRSLKNRPLKRLHPINPCLFYSFCTEQRTSIKMIKRKRKIQGTVCIFACLNYVAVVKTKLANYIKKYELNRLPDL